MQAEGAGMLISAACVAGLHLWRRNALLSIAVGTGLYMAWVQLAPWHRPEALAIWRSTVHSPYIT
ncbi:AzlD domain-containing protein [Cobetia marina]